MAVNLLAKWEKEGLRTVRRRPGKPSRWLSEA